MQAMPQSPCLPQLLVDVVHFPTNRKGGVLVFCLQALSLEEPVFTVTPCTKHDASIQKNAWCKLSIISLFYLAYQHTGI